MVAWSSVEDTPKLSPGLSSSPESALRKDGLLGGRACALGRMENSTWRGPSPWASLSVQVRVPTAFSSVFLKDVTTLVPTSSLKKEKEKTSPWYNTFRERALRLISGPDPFPIWEVPQESDMIIRFFLI